MPVQTTKKTNIYMPDGAKVSVQTTSGGAFFDVGTIMSDVTATLNWEENLVETANAGELDKQIKKMIIDGAFTLGSLDPEGVEKMGGGIFTRVVTAGTAVTAFDNQTIATFVAGTATPLVPVVTATGKAIRFSAAPVLTSVTASTSGVLAANDDYTLIADDCTSGYSIVFNTDGTATVATTETIVIVFGSNDPVASTTIYAGTSSAVLSAYALKIEHTDDNGKKRTLDLFSVNPNSGGFQFNFKGVTSEGIEEMPLAFMAKVDTSKTNGRQLFSWTIEDGAM